MDHNSQSATQTQLDEISEEQQPACVNCGGSLTGEFCQHCGERKFDPHHLTLRHFLEHAVEGLTHADNRILRSLKFLVVRPGHLTNEYMEGRRKPYLQPVQLFLVVNLLFFLIQTFSVLSPLTTPLGAHIKFMPYREKAKHVVEQEIAKRHLTLEEYTARFDAKEETEAKTLVIVMVPGFALLLALLQARRGAVMIQHLVFAFHFYAFSLLVLAILGLGLTLFSKIAINLRIGSQGAAYVPGLDLALSWFLAIILGIYLFLSQQAVYRRGWVLSLITSPVLLFVGFEILQVYRQFLFYLTVHSL